MPTKRARMTSIDKEARRLESQELLLREAEAELASERITGELGLSPRPIEEEDGDGDGGGGGGGDAAPTPKAPGRTKKEGSG